jgi:hypothetical protein
VQRVREPIGGSDILYTAEGNMVCAVCSDLASLRGHEQRAAGRWVGGLAGVAARTHRG